MSLITSNGTRITPPDGKPDTVLAGTLEELQKLREDFDKYRSEQAAYQAAQEHRTKIAERNGFWLGIISNGIAAMIGGLAVYYWPSITAFFFKLFQ